MTTLYRLADLMRISTQDDHHKAESSPFISDLIMGKLSLEHYGALLAQYAHLYTALDGGAAAVREIQRFKKLLDPRLSRAQLIRADLRALGTPTAEPLVSTWNYLCRIHQVAAHAPHRYLAHHYVRFLGDLSGGQLLSRKLQQHYRARAEQLSAWDFSALGKLNLIRTSIGPHSMSWASATSKKLRYLKKSGWPSASIQRCSKS